MSHAVKPFIRGEPSIQEYMLNPGRVLLTVAFGVLCLVASKWPYPINLAPWALLLVHTYFSTRHVLWVANERRRWFHRLEQFVSEVDEGRDPIDRAAEAAGLAVVKDLIEECFLNPPEVLWVNRAFIGDPIIDHPPALAELVLAISTSSRMREAELGDAAERYQAMLNERGRLRATVLYWADALRSLPMGIWIILSRVAGHW